MNQDLETHFKRVNEEAGQFHEYMKQRGWQGVEHLKTRFLYEVLRDLEYIEDDIQKIKQEAANPLFIDWIASTIECIATDTLPRIERTLALTKGSVDSLTP